MTLYPSIDLKDSKCVRLRQGAFDTVETVAEDPVAVAQGYAQAGARWIHVVDLDGAKDGVAKNSEIVRDIVKAAKGTRIQLGGGLRSLEDCRRALSLGVSRLVLGSIAVENPEIVKAALEEFTPEKIAVGIDSKGGIVRTRGWVQSSGRTVFEIAMDMEELGVKTLIVTDIDKDGLLSGPSYKLYSQLASVCKQTTIIASGGVSSLADIKELRKAMAGGAIVGKALYSGSVDIHEAIAETTWDECFEKQILVPTIVQNEDTGKVLMLGYMNREALQRTLESPFVIFYSRSRKKFWLKGETSGNTLTWSEIYHDCDRDTLLIKAKPAGPTCHTGNESCFTDCIRKKDGNR
jgi:phosphoribosylformimino-5-aminoimidazole carboxamide ribotide isomerase